MRNFKDMPSKNQFKHTWQEEQKKTKNKKIRKKQESSNAISCIKQLHKKINHINGGKEQTNAYLFMCLFHFMKIQKMQTV